MVVLLALRGELGQVSFSRAVVVLVRKRTRKRSCFLCFKTSISQCLILIPIKSPGREFFVNISE